MSGALPPHPVDGGEVPPDSSSDDMGAVSHNPARHVEPDYVAESRLETEEFSYSWPVPIENFLEMRNTSREIRSPVFFGGESSNHSWHLVLRPTVRFDGLNSVEAFLILNEFGDNDNYPWRQIRACFEIALMGQDGHPIIYSGNLDGAAAVFMQNTGWGLPDFMLDIDVDQYVVNGALQFRCRARIEIRMVHRIIEQINGRRVLSSSDQEAQAVASVANDLKRFFMETESKDVTFSLNNGSQTTKAHKHILMARSPVFAKMFSQGTKESRENSVTIVDFDIQTVNGMLEWIYTGKTELLFRKAPWLLQIAEKYDLQGLKEDAQNVLVDNLRVQNVMKLLLLAHMYNAPYLKKQATAFLSRNKKEVSSMPDFAEMSAKFSVTGLGLELFTLGCQ